MTPMSAWPAAGLALGKVRAWGDGGSSAMRTLSALAAEEQAANRVEEVLQVERLGDHEIHA
jgi:hypothetical protein